VKKVRTNSFFVTSAPNPVIAYTLYGAKKEDEPNTVDLEEFIDVKGWKSIGNKLESGTIRTVHLIATEEPEVEETTTSSGRGNDDEEDEDASDVEEIVDVLETEDENEEAFEVSESDEFEEDKLDNDIIDDDKIDDATLETPETEIKEQPKVESKKTKSNPVNKAEDIDFEITNLKNGEQGTLF
jgi:hypothetical protein